MNGSGCIAGGERGLMASESESEVLIRRVVRAVAVIAAIAGAAWCALGIWELASRTYVTARVEGIVAEDGQCRRPSGRYQNCMQSKVMVAFKPLAAAEETRSEILIPQKNVMLQAGDPIQIGYRADNPKDIELPDVSGTLQTPLGLLLTSIFILVLERLTRQSPKA